MKAARAVGKPGANLNSPAIQRDGPARLTPIISVKTRFHLTIPYIFRTVLSGAQNRLHSDVQQAI